MRTDRSTSRQQLAGTIRRQVGDRVTKRFLNTLPAFHVSGELPDRFRSLLDRLDETETIPAEGRKR